MAPTTSFLKVSGDKIVKSDDPSETPVLLRGAGLGGWMNMENVSSLLKVWIVLISWDENFEKLTACGAC
jgi:hypothetical protein